MKLKTLIKLTPVALRCGPIASSCPGVYRQGDNLVIVGKLVNEEAYPELAGRVGEGECAVEIPGDLLTKVFDEDV